MKQKFLLLLCLVLLVGFIPMRGETGYAASSADYAALRIKWKTLLTGGALTGEQLSDPNIQSNIATVENNARSYWASMDTSASRTAIWYGDKFEQAANQSAFFSQTYSRLRTMALAGSMSGTTFTSAEKAALKTDIIAAMDWVYEHWYNPSVIPVPPSYSNQASWPGNWFDFQIAAPMSINDILVLMYEDFSPAQIQQYVGTILHYNTDMEYGGGKGGTLMTGANLAYKATVYTLAGANLQVEAPLQEVNGKLGAIFAYSTGYPDELQRDLGDGGFYEDGSYIQHYAHPYIGGYGIAMLNYLTKIIYELHGSPWELTDPRQSNMYRWFYDSIQPFIYRGAMMEMVRGREVAVPGSSDHVRGASMIRSLLFLADSANPTDAMNFRRAIKHWIETDTYRSIYAGATIPEVLRINQLLGDSTVTAAPAPVMNKVFSIMDRVVHLRPDFGFGLSMYSNRIQNYEMLNNQNLRGWYQGEGMTYLYNNDLGQFSDQFWPTVNKLRLPGTTVDTRSLSAKQYADQFSGTNWVGGTSIIERDSGSPLAAYGAAGMDLKGKGTTLTGKKSWFMFDNEIVALGAGITSTSGNNIETIVENRKILNDGSNTLTVNGVVPNLTMGAASVQSSVYWAHLQGNTADSDIGYYFPATAGLSVLKESRTGQWSSMTTYESDNKVVTLNPLKDAYVHEGARGNENFGSSTSLNIKGSSIADHARNSLLAFDLTGITNVVNAKLLVFGSNTQGSTAFPIAARGVEDDSWSESGVTWNNSPAPLTGILSTAQVNNLPQYIEWDVTAFVSAQASGDGLATILLQDQSGTDQLFTANSREASYNKPQLVIQTDPAYTRSYASLAVNHGKNPVNAAYAYVLLPGKSTAQVKAYADQPDIAVIRNDAAVQAVRDKKLNLTAANFWTASAAAPATAGPVTAYQPSSVMVKDNGDSTVDVSISDPTHLNAGTIDIELNRAADTFTTQDNITVTQLNPIRFSVHTAGSDGKTFSIRFQTASTAQSLLPAAADAYIRDGAYADTTIDGAAEPLLRAKTSTAGYSRKSYIKFDLTGISDVKRAKLRLYGGNSENANPILVQAFSVENDSWTESSITWNNAPAPSLYPLDAVTATNVAQYREWDVTAFIQSQLASDQTATIMLLGDSLNFSANSREHTENRPMLLIN